MRNLSRHYFQDRFTLGRIVFSSLFWLFHLFQDLLGCWQKCLHWFKEGLLCISPLLALASLSLFVCVWFEHVFTPDKKLLIVSLPDHFVAARNQGYYLSACRQGKSLCKDILLRLKDWKSHFSVACQARTTMPVMSGPSLKIRISCLCLGAEKEVF